MRQSPRQGTKKPHKIAERTQKHKNIEYEAGRGPLTKVNILAFFSVVASSQISPQYEVAVVTSSFRAQRYVKKINLQKLSGSSGNMLYLRFETNYFNIKPYETDN